MASVGPTADKVPVNSKCCDSLGFRKGLGLSPMFTEPLAQSLPGLLWVFYKTLCDVLCVVNNFCCLGLGFFLPFLRAGVYTPL